MKELIIFFLLTFGISTIGYSCLCKNPNFPLNYLSQNDTLPLNKKHRIIKGKVLNQFSNTYSVHGKGLAYNIKVLEHWPKDMTLYDTITLIEDDLYCSPIMIEDSIYLIGTFPLSRYLGTSVCEGTQLFSKFRNQINSLGPGFIHEQKKPNKIKNNKTLNKRKKSFAKSFLLPISLFLGLSILLNIYLILKLKKVRA